ncbi:hypothetical protein E1263_15705 [Kribbella antibiotica]|uniref:Uncharacterized protein n=1 Tax=Kribbella antibiotica TaxID=190195 RepID=A0A4R4ZQJ2_9ACTN|nr:hypothetical protein [Kribbella antibiotica]TDD59222.1 hypothetical protein E1263_15705 [Kribbella antibiotica]
MAVQVPDGFNRLAASLFQVYLRGSLQRKGDESQPIFACIQDELDLETQEEPDKPAVPAVLRMLSDRLRPGGAKSPELQVPHVLVGLVDKSPGEGPDKELQPVSTAEVGELVKLLDQATAGLKDNHAGGYDFPRYDLVRWLMSLKQGNLRQAMYRRAVGGSASADSLWGRVQQQLPSWLQVLTLWLLPTYFWLRHSGRVPKLSGQYRWLRNQSYLARGDDNLFELALRLTEDKRNQQDPERLAGLLVNAFLEDLRSGFRRVEWIHKHRATHPIVLVGPISRINGGYLLVRMVAEVRNDTLRFDPLVLVTIGRKVPPRAIETREVKVDRDIAAWRTRHMEQSLRRWIGAWLLVFPIAGKAVPAVPRAVGRRATAAIPQKMEAEKRPEFARLRGPLWRRRTGGWLIIGAVLAVLAATYAGFGVLDDRRHCGGDGFRWLFFEAVDTSVAKVDGDCVGVTDGTNALLYPSLSFGPVGDKILEQNWQTVELSKRQPERPVITLVFMTSANDRLLSAGGLTAEREQLAGLAVAQKVQLEKPAQRYEPIVRVLIANAGPQFRHADRVAQQLGALAAKDPSIVAVVGLDESRESTQSMIRKLAAVGLPTVAATLTADQMVDVSRMYVQISPQNRREAAVAAAYVNDRLKKTGKDPFGRALARKLTVYKSDDPADTYSQNLAKDLVQEFQAVGIPGEAVSYSSQGTGLNAAQAGQDACDHRGEIVFFAGRGQVDFQAFVGGLQDRCRTQPPYLIGGDDVTKYVADRATSRLNQSIPFQYLALSLAPDLLENATSESADFYGRLEEMFQYETDDRGRSLDGHAALSYDAAYAVVLATSFLRRDSIAVNGGTVWSALQSITDADGAKRGFQGVTGRIDFGGSVSRRVPVNKPVAIVTFQRGKPVPKATIVCGAKSESPSWCPVD